METQASTKLNLSARIPKKLLYLIRANNGMLRNESSRSCFRRLIVNLFERCDRNDCQSEAYAMRPSFQTLYRGSEERIKDYWSVEFKNKPELNRFFEEQKIWFEANYWPDCDRTTHLEERVTWFLLQWSATLYSTSDLFTVEGSLEWILLDRERFRLGQNYFRRQLAGRLEQIMPMCDAWEQIEMMEKAGYLRRQYGEEMRQLLLPMPEEKIAGELPMDSQEASVRSLFIGGMIDRSISSEHREILEDLTQGRAYLFTRCGVIVSVLTGPTETGPVGLQMNLHPFRRNQEELSNKIQFALRNIIGNVWQCVEIWHPRPFDDRVERLTLWNPVQWALNEKPALAKRWSRFHNDRDVAIAKYGHLLDQLKKK